jgi:hypothetical protein
MPSQERREQGEVDSGPAEPVDEDERRALPTDEITGAHAVDVCDPRLEPSEERCFRHVRSIFCRYGLGRSAEPLSAAAEMEGRV